MNNNKLNTPVNSLVPLGVPGAEMINNLHQNMRKLNNKVNVALNNTLNGVTNVANNLGDGVANVANNIGNGVANVANNLGNGVANVANNLGNGVANVANNLGNGVANVANNLGGNNLGTNNFTGNNALSNNGGNNLIGNAARNNFGNGVANVANNLGKGVTNVANNISKGVNNVVKNIGIAPINLPITNESTAQTGWITMLMIFGVLVFIFSVIFLFFQQEITNGLNSFFTSVRDALGMEVAPPPPSDKNEVTKPSTPPDQESNIPTTIAEKMLPTGAPGSEVFAVSKNTFTYYDAQPLCKALGAELATYDQVKAAWDKGADWCNYGWVKGQNAIFPTQTDTWQKLQAGPEEERGACGRPGINGGYFDNPELRFGVNCYGPKPAQSTHDEATIAKRTGQPLTVGALEVEKKVNKFRSEADNIGLLPFNGNKWESS
jgi:hypothetical protein